MNISIIPNHEIDSVWNQIKDYVEDAAKYTYGRFTANDIRNGIKKNLNQQLWVAHDDEVIHGFVVTEPIDYPQLKAMIMLFIGGFVLHLWKDDMLSTIQKFAYSIGCDCIESQGRSGWERLFKNDGYKKRFVAYELPVEETV
jgi:hypothetical protein